MSVNDCGYGGIEGASAVEDGEIPLSALPIGGEGEITFSSPDMRGRKKFADVGLIPGAKVIMEARAPFGSLFRICLLGTSIAISTEDSCGLFVRPIKSGRVSR